MKRINLSICFILVCVCAGAQGHRQLDSLKYMLPEFSQGTVIFADKHVSRGILNISPLDQSVYCLSGKDTLYVDGNPDILRVSAAGRSFVKWKESFVEVVVTQGTTGIGISRSTVKIDNVKAGAFGGTTATSSTKTYSVDSSSGTFHDLILEDPRNYVYKKTPYLYNDGKFLPVSRKSFEKLFPGQKDFIESVWAGRNITVTDINSVMAFYNELLQK